MDTQPDISPHQAAIAARLAAIAALTRDAASAQTLTAAQRTRLEALAHDVARFGNAT